MPAIFLYAGQPNPSDVKLSDPTVLSGGTDVNVSVSGFLVALFLGAAIVTADANYATVGLSSSASFGAPVITANANYSIGGMESPISIGAPVISAAANCSAVGFSTSGALGNPVVTANASPGVTGIASSSLIGSLTVTANGMVAQTGVTSTASIGSGSITGSATINAFGISSTANPGALGVTADAVVPVIGTSTTALVWIAAPSGSVNVIVSGIGMPIALGFPTATADANALCELRAIGVDLGEVMVLTESEHPARIGGGIARSRNAISSPSSVAAVGISCKAMIGFVEVQTSAPKVNENPSSDSSLAVTLPAIRMLIGAGEINCENVPVIAERNFPDAVVVPVAIGSVSDQASIVRAQSVARKISRFFPVKQDIAVSAFPAGLVIVTQIGYCAIASGVHVLLQPIENMAALIGQVSVRVREAVFKIGAMPRASRLHGYFRKAPTVNQSTAVPVKSMEISTSTGIVSFAPAIRFVSGDDDDDIAAILVLLSDL